MKSALLWLLVFLAACKGTQAQPDDGLEGWEPDPRPMAQTLVYQCPDHGEGRYEFITRRGPGEMALWLEDRYLVLSQVRSASGVKYEEGDVVFWMKGDESFLDIGLQRHRGCQLAPARAPWEDARRRGVVFRAVGNEPGWYLEIKQDGPVLYVGDYGALRIEIANPASEEESGVRIYHGDADNHRLRVEVVEGVCVDSMKGDSFPFQVVLQVDGNGLQGCGRSLKPLR
jgi:putative lipoprotein